MHEPIKCQQFITVPISGFKTTHQMDGYQLWSTISLSCVKDQTRSGLSQPEFARMGSVLGFMPDPGPIFGLLAKHAGLDPTWQTQEREKELKCDPTRKVESSNSG